MLTMVKKKARVKQRQRMVRNGGWWSSAEFDEHM
jgi:hypothetical protein